MFWCELCESVQEEDGLHNCQETEKEKVLYVGLQKGDSKLGIPGLHLVDVPSGTTLVFDPEKHEIIGLTETAKKRGITIPSILRTFLFALTMLTGSLVAVASADEAGCGYYVWHDHHRHNYVKKHKHEVCDSLSDHYRLDEPLYVDYFHAKRTVVTKDRETQK